MKRDESLARFEGQFDAKVRDGLFLVKRSMGKGSAVCRGSEYRLTGTRYLAWVDCETNELHSQTGGLRLMYRTGLFSDRQDCDGLGIYHVRFRVNSTSPTDRMIVKILGKADDPRLAAILDEYTKPVVVTNELGTFQLDRDFDSYEGRIPYLSGEASVSLQVKEGSTDAEAQFDRLKQACHDLKQFDATVRRYIAEDEVLWDWLDEDEGDHAGFEQELGEPTIAIDEDGELEAWFYGGEPFGYHSIVVSVDEDNTCTGINLVG
jgi:hypothetical protein